MPTYEYRCPEGHDFERFYRKISDATDAVSCPECGKVAARIMSAGGGLLFKGSGFYLTDYGKNAHRGATAPAKSDGGGEGGGSKESTAAPAAAKESGGSTAGGGESKSSADSKPAPAAPKAEAKPATSSSAPKPKKDK